MEFPLRLATILRESDDHVVEGVLHCTNPNCQHEFPIIDGIPVILSGLRDYVGNNVLPILARSDLHSTTQSLLSDCLGPGSALDAIRYQLSCYSWEHYGRYDPQEQGATLQPRATLALLHRGIEMCGSVPEGVVFDVGCGVGGMTFATAELSNSLVLGIDVNFGMLRLAQQVLRTGQVSYPRRRIGVVYDQREFSIPQTNFENVDFWACDATALPFPKSSANFLTALNILDCVSSPTNLLTSLTAVLVPGGQLIAATPYDWSAGVTPFETWLGGHSQRGGDSGAGEPLLRKLLTPGGHPYSIAGLELVAEDQNVPWTVRLHDRSTMSYLVHLIIAQRRE